MKKIFITLLIFLLFIISNIYAIDTKTIYLQSVGSVLAISALTPQGICNGTGFFVLESDIIATSYHLVDGAVTISAKDYNDNEYKIEGIIDFSETMDIAILKTSKKGKTLPLEVNLPISETNVYALGNPLDLNFAFTDGIVSQIQNKDGMNLIEFTSPVSSGNSGGPILNDDGKVLGIVSTYLSKDKNINLAVPVAMLYMLNKNKKPKYDDKMKKFYEEIMKDMVKCPAGSFMMGSPKDELGIDYGETLHEVYISKPFFIGKYEVTQDLYEHIMNNNPSEYKGKKHPVETVLYDEAKNFCEKLNTMFKDFLPQGYKFDLPTEAQWEYACRAGTKTSLNSNKNITIDEGYCPNFVEIAWYRDNSDLQTHPVGLKKPNAWGIYDMHGNIAEWCRDWYGDYPNYSVTDPICTKDNSEPVLRGGSFNCIQSYCRSSSRDSIIYCQTGYNIGFRIALVPIQ